MPEPPRIFLSYARSDGKAFAATLRRQLDPHFSHFQDIANLEGGHDWWQQIDKALHTVEFMVLVLTPAAIESKYVEKEWRLARQLGVCVIPVFGLPPDHLDLARALCHDDDIQTEFHDGILWVTLGLNNPASALFSPGGNPPATTISARPANRPPAVRHPPLARPGVSAIAGASPDPTLPVLLEGPRACRDREAEPPRNTPERIDTGQFRRLPGNPGWHPTNLLPSNTWRSES